MNLEKDRLATRLLCLHLTAKSTKIGAKGGQEAVKGGQEAVKNGVIRRLSYM